MKAVECWRGAHGAVDALAVWRLQWEPPDYVAAGEVGDPLGTRPLGPGSRG